MNKFLANSVESQLCTMRLYNLQIGLRYRNEQTDLNYHSVVVETATELHDVSSFIRPESEEG